MLWSRDPRTRTDRSRTKKMRNLGPENFEKSQRSVDPCSEPPFPNAWPFWAQWRCIWPTVNVSGNPPPDTFIWTFFSVGDIFTTNLLLIFHKDLWFIIYDSQVCPLLMTFQFVAVSKPANSNGSKLSFFDCCWTISENRNEFLLRLLEMNPR